MTDIPVCPMEARSSHYPKKALDKSRSLPLTRTQEDLFTFTLFLNTAP